MNRAVIDASVVLKWYLPDEQYGSRALRILDQYMMEDLDITVPTLLEYEVINGLAIARRRGRLDEKHVTSAMEGFLNLRIKVVQSTELYKRVLYYCHVFNRSAYDASYLALAEKEKIQMITADERLFNSVKNKLKWVKWLGEF